LCSQLNKHIVFLTDKVLIINSHLSRLSVDKDDVNQEPDSDIEVDDAQQVNDDFIRLNLSKTEYSSEEI
jgi:hypothetical protein